MFKHFHIGDIRDIRSLGRFRRMAHPRARRHFMGVALGVVFMLTGSRMALNHWHAVPHVVWDSVAYFIHAIGTIPLLKHVEPAWAVLMMERIKEATE